MARSLYITSAEGDTHKSTIALGVLDLLSRTVKNVGVFRPVARSMSEPDYVVELLLAKDGMTLSYEECIGTDYDTIHADPDHAMSLIISRYREVERQCGAVVIVGTDYTDVSGSTELAFNAKVAANLGSPALVVVGAQDRSPHEVRQIADLAAGSLADNHAQVIATVANRCDPAQLDSYRQALAPLPWLTYAVPEDPLLTAPTVRAVMEAVDGELLFGDPELLSRECSELIIGAMEIEHMLTRISDGAVVITPGDREGLLLALVTAHAASNFPSLAGIILNGGFLPSDVMTRLVQGLHQRVPIIRTSMGTFTTAVHAGYARGRLTQESQRKIDTALKLFEDNVDGAALRDALEVSTPDVVTPLMFEYELIDRARSDRMRIVLPEGNEDRILRAASTLLARGVADLTLLGVEKDIRARAVELSLDIDAAQVIDPHDPELCRLFAEEYARIRAHKGMTVERALEIVPSVSYFGTMMVHLGLADGMVSGAVHTTAHTIKPSFEIIKTNPGVGIVSSVFFMCLEDRVLVYGDCAVNPDPSAEQLADIAISSAGTAAAFGIDPRIAMLSYSTGASGTGADVDKVRRATELVMARRPDLAVDGPLQYDAAVDASVARTKLPGSDVAGRATVFVFPDLNTGNNTYKAVQRSAGAVAVGPVLQGLRKPVNDLSRGALVQDIVNTVAITAVQAQAVRAAEAAARAAGTDPDAARAEGARTEGAGGKKSEGRTSGGRGAGGSKTAGAKAAGPRAATRADSLPVQVWPE